MTDKLREYRQPGERASATAGPEPVDRGGLLRPYAMTGGRARPWTSCRCPRTNLRAIAISHGHVDRHGGLEGLFTRYGRRRLPLLIHPGAWRDRKIAFPTGAEVRLPPPSRADLEREGLEVVEERGPTLLLDGRVLISGQVPRVSDFETGSPIHLARRGDGVGRMVPAHCTGWKATHLLARDLPGAFVQPSMGTVLRF